MRVLVVGGTGFIGQAVIKECQNLGFETLSASLNHGDLQVDLTSHDSIEKMYQKAGKLDAVISCPGAGRQMDHLMNLSIEDYKASLEIKSLGQIDLVLTGLQYLDVKGSFTLTTGILSQGKLPKSSCAATANNAVEGFVKSASLEMPHNMRINVVSPNVITEALDRYGEFFVGYEGVSIKKVALSYIQSLVGIINGEILKVW